MVRVGRVSIVPAAVVVALGLDDQQKGEKGRGGDRVQARTETEKLAAYLAVGAGAFVGVAVLAGTHDDCCYDGCCDFGDWGERKKKVRRETVFVSGGACW